MEISVPADFLSLALQAMVNLKKNGKSNVLYRLARGLSTMRKDGAGSKFPINRMPMGLLEYMVGYFDSQTSSQVYLPVLYYGNLLTSIFF